MSDGALTSSATVTVTVTAVNDAPVAAADALSTAEDTAIVITAASLVANDVDVDRDALVLIAVGSASAGSVELLGGDVVYTPAADFFGTATFDCTVSDGTLTSAGMVTVSVTPVNDAPVAANDSAIALLNREKLILGSRLVANDVDVDGDPLAVTSVGNEVGGTVVLDGLDVRFTPTPGFVGLASFEYTVSDGIGAVAIATVMIDVRQEGVVALAAGGYHTCAILLDGSVKCWGHNSYGELGNGSVSSIGDRAIEMGIWLRAVDLGAGRTATALSLGTWHTCVLLDDASVKCWGRNDVGQLGLGDAFHRGDAPGEMGDALPPIDLGSNRWATAVACGERHSCAILDDGTVKCWGDGANGQLGYGDTSTRGNDPGEMGDLLPAIELGTGRTAVALTAGFRHTCALLDDESVKCWGLATSGSLGSGDSLSRGDQPGEMGDALPSVDIGTGRTVSSIATGPYSLSTCAILDDRTVKCWGENSRGQLGLGDNAHRGDSVGEMGDALPVVDLGAGSTAVALAAGTHSCAILDDGTVKCWGLNVFGSLGLGDNLNRGDGPGEMGDALPTVDLGTGLAATSVSAGIHTCALLDDATVKCWGFNSEGVLGLGDVFNRGDQPGEMGDALPPVDL